MPAAHVAVAPLSQFKRCNVLYKSIFISLVLGALGFQAQAQKAATEEINRVDGKGARHGKWLLNQPGRMGEASFSEFGTYDHGTKMGQWYKLDNEGDLMAIETFKGNVLDGEVKYYDKGKLTTIGYYLSLNPANDFDTFYVVDPITDVEVRRIIPTDKRTIRHGTWRFYDTENGRLVREEDYQADELVFHKDYEMSKADSLYYAKRQTKLPHAKKKVYTPPTAKQTSYTN